jgi:molybdenum cofactor cytidylyltransferase
MPKVAAIVLAAGRSRRMGAFKPLLPWGDKTVIESCVDYLSEGGAETIVVVVGHRSDDVKEKLNRSVIVALNPDPDSEMSESIACGLRELPADAGAVLIVPADHPAISHNVVSQLIAEWRRGGRLVIPEFNGRGGHPALVDLYYRDESLSLDPSRGLRALFEAHRDEVRRVLVESPYIARDMDTWDDYRALHLEVFGSEPSYPTQSLRSSI